MTPDEVFLLKSWDSREPASAVAPHSAFSLPNEVDKAARESLEVRTFVVLD